MKFFLSIMDLNCERGYNISKFKFHAIYLNGSTTSFADLSSPWPSSSSINSQFCIPNLIKLGQAIVIIAIALQSISSTWTKLSFFNWCPICSKRSHSPSMGKNKYLFHFYFLWWLNCAIPRKIFIWLKNMYLYKRLHPINPDLPDGENWPKLINDCNKSENVWSMKIGKSQVFYYACANWIKIFT